MPIIHVAQDAIRRNAKLGTDDPAIIVRRGRKATRHKGIELVVDGKVVGQFIYQPHKPLSCGARLWLELAPNVEIRDVEDQVSQG
jgi:hypothetical protein